MSQEALFVIYPPGAGGNHLANIISTAPRFHSRIGTTYLEPHSIDAHVSGIDNFDIGQLGQFPNQARVLCGHVFEYWWAERSIKQHFAKRKYLIVEIDDPVCALARARLESLGITQSHPYNYQSLATMYSIEFVSRLLDEHDFFSIKINTIFSPDVDPLLDCLEQQMHLDLDPVLTKSLHAKWIKIIQNQFQPSQ